MANLNQRNYAGGVFPAGSGSYSTQLVATPESNASPGSALLHSNSQSTGTHVSVGPTGQLLPQTGITSASASKESLHAYIYDYLYKNGLARAAAGFLQDVPGVSVHPTSKRKLEGGNHSTTSPKRAATSAYEMNVKLGDSALSVEESTLGGGVGGDAGSSSSDRSSSSTAVSHFGFAPPGGHHPGHTAGGANDNASATSPSDTAPTPPAKSLPGSDLPRPKVEHDVKTGHLFTWWSVYSDIFAALHMYKGSAGAKAYVATRSSSANTVRVSLFSVRTAGSQTHNLSSRHHHRGRSPSPSRRLPPRP